jgi:hypothetical protein
MEQLIRSITTTFTSKLPEDKSFYTSDDLREFDIPEFLVQRVEVEIYKNLNESIVPPHSEWADMSARDVEEAWEQFIEAIVAEVRMPSSFARTVFETAIADLMDMILEPRKSIPEVLFGPKKKLSFQEVEKQLPAITVNSHLAQAVRKYMIRKDLDEIEIGTARRIVMKVDERITANYNSLNWAQLLQPLFILAGPKIDTELFRIFFRDRNMDRISRRFDLLSGSLSKIEFIETLSSPDLLNEEGYDDDQVSLFDAQHPEKSDAEREENPSSNQVKLTEETESDELNRSEPELKGETLMDEAMKSEEEAGIDQEKSTEKTQDFEEIHTGADHQDDSDEDDSLAGSFIREQDEDNESENESENLNTAASGESEEELDSENVDDDEENEPLYNRFDQAEEDDMPGEGEEEDSDQFADQFLYDEEEKALNETIEVDEPQMDTPSDSDEKKALVVDREPEATEEEESDTDETEEGESPIWQSFLGDEEHIDEEDIPEYSDYSDTADEDDEAPLIDLTVKEDEAESAEHLIGWLKDDEDRFVSQIFSGSEKAYEEALIDLNQLENWKQASRFIEKEIFARNLVDMYDEEAVDFTDRLQTYFDEYKS